MPIQKNKHLKISKRMSLMGTVLASYPYARLVDESNAGYQIFSVYSFDKNNSERLSSAPLPDVAWARAKRVIESRGKTFMKNLGLKR